MALYKISGKKLSDIKEAPIKLERELQSITENNLGTLFGLEFVSSEFQRDGLRIDTLAFDRSINAFVVIEYKRDHSFSIVDQGVAYLSLMLNNKEVFLVEYNERQSMSLKRDEIDWSQSKVMFLAKAFTNHQQVASGFRDFPIELWQVTRYADGLILYDRIQTRKTSAAMSAVRPGKVAADVVKQVKTYTESDVMPPSGKTREMYEALRDRVLKLDDELRVNPTKTYISFRRGEDWRNIVIVAFRSARLRIDFPRIQPSDVNDPEHKLEYLKDSVKHWGQHVSILWAQSGADLDYVVYIAQQALEKFRISQAATQ